MADAIGVLRGGALTAHELAARSRAALDRPLAFDAELFVARFADEARILGAFQRRVRGGENNGETVLRRGSGGGEVRAGEGTVHVLLALSHPGALVPCDAARLVNRYVRPLLRAITKACAPAAYFGRDSISVSGRPAAAVVFAHDASSRRATFEAFVGVRVAFADGGRASFRGKTPGSLEAITSRSIDVGRLEDAIVESYAAAYAREIVVLDGGARDAHERDGDDVPIDPAWRATREEAIGVLGAGEDRDGRFRVGGDWLVSRDAVAALEARLAALPAGGDGADEVRVAAAALACLGQPGVALEGVASLRSVVDIITRARAR